MESVEHHKGCNANYPEKLEWEIPKQLTVMDIGDGESVVQCVDCGAFVVVPNVEVNFEEEGRGYN